ncbi:MAG: galactokinase [Gemmatimonadales bacterium]|nr:galactokinase [Gemmatimonadales bacterium]
MRLASSLFESSFSSRPAVAVSAPGRVNLIGEHTDYNGGPVLPVALERRTAVTAALEDGWFFVSVLDATVRGVEIERPLRGDWTDYLVGVVRELRAIGAAPTGARVAVASTLPVGAGLSSSAALTVAAAKALSLLGGRRLTPGQLVEVAYRAEHDQVGVHCGRMDQTIAAHGAAGTALLFETATGSIQRVPFPGRMWVVETGVSHRLSEGELNQRRRECEEALALCRRVWPGLAHLADLSTDDLPTVKASLAPELAARVRHVVTETFRTRMAADALARGDMGQLGWLLAQGHESLRVDFQSTVVEADAIVELAMEQGAHGARLTGAGWGGAVVVLTPEDRSARIMAEITRGFAGRFGREPVIWSSRPASGVRRETVRG